MTELQPLVYVRRFITAPSRSENQDGQLVRLRGRYELATTTGGHIRLRLYKHAPARKTVQFILGTLFPIRRFSEYLQRRNRGCGNESKHSLQEGICYSTDAFLIVSRQQCSSVPQRNKAIIHQAWLHRHYLLQGSILCLYSPFRWICWQ